MFPADAGNIPTFIYHTECRGSELSLGQCSLNMFPNSGSGCNRFDGAIARCIGKCCVWRCVYAPRFLHLQNSAFMGKLNSLVLLLKEQELSEFA